MKIALCGLGRAGKELLRVLKNYDDLKLVSAFCRIRSEKAGMDIGAIADLPPMGIEAVDITHADKVFTQEKPDVVIDFSNTTATKLLLLACKKHQVSAVVCTTGFNMEEIAWMKECVFGEDFGIVFAPNVTVGVNVMMNMLKTAAHCLPYYDYNINEIHHNKKLDKPSGTAKKIALLLKNELPLEADEQVSVNSIRAGGYVGVHEVMAVGEYDRITIVHESFSRRVFAEGAIKAAKYIANKTGWHEMEDVVNYKDDIISVRM